VRRKVNRLEIKSQQIKIKTHYAIQISNSIMAPILRVVHFRWIRVLFTLKEEKCPSTKGQMKTNRQNKREKTKIGCRSARPRKQPNNTIITIRVGAQILMEK
jgi:hypothetical protein